MNLQQFVDMTEHATKESQPAVLFRVFNYAAKVHIITVEKSARCSMMLNPTIGAYESAVLLMLPLDVIDWGVMYERDKTGAWCTIPDKPLFEGDAATPALALATVILRSYVAIGF